MNSSTKEAGSSSLSMRSRAVSLPSARCRAAAFGVGVEGDLLALGKLLFEIFPGMCHDLFF
jgi:hypothetical protein